MIEELGGLKLGNVSWDFVSEAESQDGSTVGSHRPVYHQLKDINVVSRQSCLQQGVSRVTGQL